MDRLTNKSVYILCTSLLISSIATHAHADMTDNSLYSTATTWKQLRDQHVIKQDKDFSCGASSLATIMNYFYQIKVTEQQLLEDIEAIKRLKRKKALQANEVTMASFLDLANVSRKYGLKAKGITTNYNSLSKLSIPVIVYLNHKRTDHFTVVRAIDDHNVYLSDSSWGNRTLTKKQFEKMWYTGNKQQGKMLLILPTNQQQKQKVNTSFIQIKDRQKLLKQTSKLLHELL